MSKWVQPLTILSLKDWFHCSWDVLSLNDVSILTWNQNPWMHMNVVLTLSSFQFLCISNKNPEGGQWGSHVPSHPYLLIPSSKARPKQAKAKNIRATQGAAGWCQNLHRRKAFAAITAASELGNASRLCPPLHIAWGGWIKGRRWSAALVFGWTSCLQDLTRFRIDDSYWLDLLGLFSLEPAFSWIASEQQKVTFTARWTKACTNFPQILHGLPGKVT